MRGVSLPTVPAVDGFPAGPTAMPRARQATKRDVSRSKTSNSFKPKGAKSRGGTASEFDTESYVNGKSKYD